MFRSDGERPERVRAEAAVAPAAVPPLVSLRWVFVPALATVAVATLLVWRDLQTEARTRSQVAHSRIVSVALERAQSLLKDAETGERGFLLTGNDAYLQPYQEAVRRLPGELDALAALTREDPLEQRSLQRMRELARQKLAELARTVQLERAGGHAEALAIVRSDSGRQLMDEIRALTASMLQEEQRLLVERSALETRDRDRAHTATWVLGALAMLLLWLVRFASERERARCFLSEQRLATTFASIGDGVIATDAHGRVELMNPVAETLTGWRLPDARGQPLARVFHIVNERSREPGENPVDKVLRSGAVVGLANHTLLIARDGRELTIEDSAAPIRRESGEIEGVVLVFQNTSAHHLVKRERNQLLQLIEQSSDFIALADREQRLVYLNPAARRFAGYTGQEFRGRALADHLTPESAREYRERLQSTLDESGDCEAELWLERRADGARIPMHWRVFVLRDPQGERLGVGAMGRDLTASRTLELKLRERDAEFHALADHIPTLCWMADETGSIFWYNSRWYEYTGTTPEQMRGWGWRSVHDPERLPEVLERWQRSLATGQPFEMVFPLRGADGVYRPFLTRIAPLRDPGGRILRWFGINTDISEQEAVQSALREADRRKDEFLATLAHELRNPLAPIQNAAQVLLKRDADAATRDWGVGVIDRQVKSMARLLEDLLDVARISRGKLVLHIQRVSLQAVIENALEITRPLITARRQQLSVRLPPKPVPLDADPLRLSQVIANLLNNAAKYTDPGGQIELTTVVTDHEVLVSVRDSGIGLEPEAIGHIFEMFSQVKGALERSEGGLGIGLALVKGLTELHGGRVEAQSAGLGRGSEFRVHLPVAQPGVQPVQAAGPGTAVPVRLRILVADDNRDAAASLGLLLELDGHEVHLAHDGIEALQAARTLRPDAALIDIGMPGMNGYEVARALRSDPDAAPTRLFALTGWGQEEDRRRSLAAGFDVHLTKPVDIEVLQAQLAPVQPLSRG